MSKITTFIFDCLGVVCDPVLNGWYRDHRLKKGLIDENIKNIFNNFDLGKFSEEDVVDYFLRYDGVNPTKEMLRKEIDNYLNLDLKLAGTILKLKEKGYKTVLLTNCNSSFFERKVYPTYPNFKNLFNEIIISSDIGMVKPNNDIFQYTLNKVGSRPEECLFVDDSKTNVVASIKVGMSSYLYTNFETFKEYLNDLKV